MTYWQADRQAGTQTSRLTDTHTYKNTVDGDYQGSPRAIKMHNTTTKIKKKRKKEKHVYIHIRLDLRKEGLTDGRKRGRNEGTILIYRNN